jgi:hypothetical protein
MRPIPTVASLTLAASKGTLMQRPIRAVAYGFAIWWIWFGFLGISRFFPASVTSAPSFASVRLLVLVLLVLLFAVDYLRRIEQGSIREGLAVGILWALLMVANDIGHLLFMEPASIVSYLTTFAPLYAWIPVATTVVFSQLTARVDRTA